MPLFNFFLCLLSFKWLKIINLVESYFKWFSSIVCSIVCLHLYKTIFYYYLEIRRYQIGKFVLFSFISFRKFDLFDINDDDFGIRFKFKEDLWCAFFRLFVSHPKKFLNNFQSSHFSNIFLHFTFTNFFSINFRVIFFSLFCFSLLNRIGWFLIIQILYFLIFFYYFFYFSSFLAIELKQQKKGSRNCSRKWIKKMKVDKMKKSKM